MLSYGIVAPAGTPRPILERLNNALNAALATDEVRKRIIKEGGEPEHQADVIDREETKWSNIIHAANLTPQ